MVPDPRLPPRAWLFVAMLWIAMFSNYFVRFLFTTMHGSIVAAIPMTEAQFGLLTSSLMWTYGLASPFAGFMADRFSRSRVVVMSMFVWSVTTWLTSYARTLEQLGVLRSLMGLAEAFYMPAAVALITDYHKGPTRSLATAIHHTGYVVGIGLSGAGGWLAEQRSWHYALSAAGLAGIAYSVPLALLLRDAPKAPLLGAAPIEARPKVSLGEAVVSLFGRWQFILMLVVHALLSLTVFTAIGWMPVFLQERFHLTQAVAGFSATGYMNAASVPGMLIGGIWADKWSRTNGRARMYVPAIGLIIAAPGILLVANTHVFVLAILGLVLYRLVGTFYGPNTMPVLCEIVDPRYRATGYGLLNMVGLIAGGLGIYFCGVLRDVKIDLHNIFNFSAIVCVISALMFASLRPGSRLGSRP